MDPYLLLDILLLILLALFVPIGFWRGAQREVLVTLGILLGVVLGEFWAGPWGRDLAARSGLSENGGVFLVAMLFLVGSSFLVGYGLGAALVVPAPGVVGRLLGALVAAGNGALLLGFALRDIRIFLLQSDTRLFEQAVVARVLSEGLGWLLLGGALLSLPVILYLALFAPGPVLEYEPEDVEFERQHTPTRRYPPRAPVTVGRPPVAYKTEPPRSAPEETRPIRVVEKTGSRGGEAPADLSTMDTAVIARGTGRQGAPDPPRPAPPGTCPHCHGRVGPDDPYCPRCGRVL